MPTATTKPACFLQVPERCRSSKTQRDAHAENEQYKTSAPSAAIPGLKIPHDPATQKDAFRNMKVRATRNGMHTLQRTFSVHYRFMPGHSNWPGAMPSVIICCYRSWMPAIIIVHGQTYLRCCILTPMLVLCMPVWPHATVCRSMCFLVGNVF